MRKITLKTKGLSTKQYSTLVLELNLVAKNWSKFGAQITVEGKSAERIISWGTRKHDDIRPETQN